MLLHSSMAAEGPGPPLGLLLLILSSVGAALELSVVSPVTAAIGSDALLECAYTVESPSVDLKYLGILWLYNESNLLVYGPGMKVFDPRVSMNESEIPNGKASLLLSNVTTSDEGPYTCSITYTPKKEQKTVTLNIQARPEIIVPEQEVVKGKENLLRCFVIGFYPMEIHVRWRRDGEVLLGTSMSKAQRSADGTFTINSTLPITPTDSDSSANFSCSTTHVSLPRFIQKDVPLLFKVDEEKGVNAAAVVLPLLLILALVAVLGGVMYRRRTHRRLCKIQGLKRWMVGEPVALVCVGHHWPTDTEIMWVKIQGGETTEIRSRCSSEQQQAMQPFLSENTYRAVTIIAQEDGNKVTLTTTLHITPSLEADEGAIFKCKFSPSDLNMKKEEEKFKGFKLFDFPGRPVAGDIVVPRLVSGEEASLHCPVSGYFPSKGLEVMWLQLKKGSCAPVPLSSGNDGCVSSMTPEPKEHPYSRTAQLVFTPDFHSDQESEFICQVSHPSLLKALEKRTPKLSIMSAPRCGDVTIAPSGDGKVVTLNVTDVYPKQIAISWSCDLPGKEGELHSERVWNEGLESSDGTYSITSHCELSEHMIRKIAQADIIVSIQHEALKEPSRVTRRLENIDNK